MQKNKKKIVLTGGHAATTALSTVEELRKRAKWDYVWVGSKKAVEGKKVRTIESVTFEDKKIPFYPIISGRLQRNFSLWTIPSLLKIPIGFFHALYLLLKIKPDIILSFGGFSAVPVVIVGWILRIPIVLHEQTAAVGRANKLLAPFANKVAISRKTSKKYFSSKKIVLSGNPTRKAFFSVKKGTNKVIFIFGGSRGSQPINKLVKPILPSLLEKYKVVHHTGFSDYNQFVRFRKNLPSDLQKKYDVYDFIELDLVPKFYGEASVMICRAGANTVSEVVATKTKAVFIPLPWNYLDEQTKNAEFASNYIDSLIVDQKTASSEDVYQAVIDLDKASSGKRDESPDKDAAKKVASLLEEVVGES